MEILGLISGLILVLLPFVIFSIFMVVQDGWKCFFVVWGITLLMATSVTLGVWVLF